jgi:hypothetical protein
MDEPESLSHTKVGVQIPRRYHSQVSQKDAVRELRKRLARFYADYFSQAKGEQHRRGSPYARSRCGPLKTGSRQRSQIAALSGSHQ